MTRLDDLSPLYWNLCIDHLLYFLHPENTETKCSYVLDQGLTVTRRNLLVNLQFQSTHNQYCFTSLQFITTDVGLFSLRNIKPDRGWNLAQALLFSLERSNTGDYETQEDAHEVIAKTRLWCWQWFYWQYWSMMILHWLWFLKLSPHSWLLIIVNESEV